MSAFLDRVNKTTVTPEVLGEVLEMHAAMKPKDRRVYEVRAIRLFELLKSKGLEDEGSDLSLAITFRLEALARLNGEPGLRAWTMPGGKKGMDYIHVDLLKAAAEEPLIEDAQQQAAFDVDGFEKRMLFLAKMRGGA